MAKYTIELRRLCDIFSRDTVESWFKDYKIEDYLNKKQIETITNSNVWSKDRLASKIVDHYYMREIGFETPALFKHYAKVTMQELMEKYLLLIYTNCIEYDPFESVDFHVVESREILGNASAKNSGKSNSNSKSNSEGLNISNNTPQTRVNKQQIDSGVYASNVGQNNNESNIEDETTTSSDSSTNSKTIETFKHDEYGNKGVLDSYQKMIMQLRETIVSVDTDIINELNSLFMGLY